MANRHKNVLNFFNIYRNANENHEMLLHTHQNAKSTKTENPNSGRVCTTTGTPRNYAMLVEG